MPPLQGKLSVFPVERMDHRSWAGHGDSSQPGWGHHLCKVTAAPGQRWHSPGCPGLPGVEAKGKRGLGFLPGIPNEWDEENGEILLLSLACGEQGIDLGDPAHKTRGFFQNCSCPHPSIIQCQCRAHNASHSFGPIQFTQAWPGLLWDFFFSFPFFFLKFPRWTFHEGQADPLLLYVNVSHNVQAMISCSFPEGLNEVFLGCCPWD